MSIFIEVSHLFSIFLGCTFPCWSRGVGVSYTSRFSCQINFSSSSAPRAGIGDISCVKSCHAGLEARHDGCRHIGASGTIVQDTEAGHVTSSLVSIDRKSGLESSIFQALTVSDPPCSSNNFQCFIICKVISCHCKHQSEVNQVISRNYSLKVYRIFSAHFSCICLIFQADSVLINVGGN